MYVCMYWKPLSAPSSQSLPKRALANHSFGLSRGLGNCQRCLCNPAPAANKAPLQTSQLAVTQELVAAAKVENILLLAWEK